MEYDLEGKLCPIDKTQLRVQTLGGWIHVNCEKCGCVYPDLNEEGLLKTSKAYLKLLIEWNKSDLKRINYREDIIREGLSNLF